MKPGQIRVPLDIGAIHFIGIGGIGMSGIAEIMHNLGYKVRGSDVADNASVKRLRAMGVEAVIVMRSADAASAPYLRKQHMQLSSKMRFLAAQFGALLEDDLWLRNAQHANAMASRLAAGLADLHGVEVVYPVESDAVFARLSRAHVADLQREWTFHVWDEGTSVVRWMTAFDTQERDVDEFLAGIAAVTGASPT